MHTVRNIQDLPVEMRCKIYKQCDMESLLNFGNAFPKYLSEIAGCLRRKKYLGDLWFKAVENGYFDWVKIVLKISPDFAGLRKDVSTALHFAVAKGYNNIVKELIDADRLLLNMQDQRGATPLHLAVCKKNFDVVKMLIKAGIDVNIKKNDGQTALHLAARYANADIVKIFIQAGANLDARDGARWTPLITAAYFGNLNVMKELISSYPKFYSNSFKVHYLNMQTCCDNTALHLAVLHHNNLDIVKLLIEAGANPYIKNYHGETAFDIAKNKPEIIAYLEQQKTKCKK
jgi:ankyrin repeat protein